MSIGTRTKNSAHHSEAFPSLKNIPLESCRKIAALCRPLNSLNVIYFHYVKSFKDGSRISLCSNQEWMEHYYNNKYYQVPAIDKTPGKNTSTNYFWLNHPSSSIFTELREKFDIGNGITLIRKDKNFCSFYYFGARPDNIGILNFYLNHMDILERFIFYFIDKAMPIIKYADKHRIKIPSSKQVHPENLQTTDNVPMIEIANSLEVFIKQTPIKKYKIFEGDKVLQFSPRQYECILGLLKGQAAKEISRELNLSNRTIESYITHLKRKLDCSRKLDLIHHLQRIFKQQER